MMDRYSFGTYLLDEHNQEAFTMCHDIANLQFECDQPILLIGDTGTGKTHLLYSIIGRLRTSSARAGIAYVTATKFPDEVSDLVAHPEPVIGAPKAVLLVDQLESFDTNLEILESVVHLFLDNGHSVVCATNVHPARLQHLPDGLSQILDNGHQVSILPQDSPTRLELLKSTIREEHEQVIARLEEDVSELRNFLTTTSESLGSEEGGDDDSLLLSMRKELEVTRAELELAEASVHAPSPNSSQPETPSLSAQYTDSLNELQEELERLRAENALSAVAVKESWKLRERIERLETERDGLQEKLEQGHTERLQNTEDPLTGVEAQEEARLLLGRAEALIEVMRRNRDEFAESQTLHAKQMEEIQELEVIFGEYEKPENNVQGDQASRGELEEQWNSKLASAEAERDDLAERLLSRQETLDSMQKEFVDLKKVVEEAEGQLAGKTEALVALDLALEEKEKESTDALIALNRQIAQYDTRIANLESSAKARRQNEAFLEGELLKLQTTIREAGGFVGGLLEVCANNDEDENTLLADSGVDSSLLDTLEGAQMLERMDLEEIEPVPTSNLTVEVSRDTTAVSPHVEGLKDNLDALAEGRSESGPDDTPESNTG